LTFGLVACMPGTRPLGWSGVSVYDGVAYYATSDGYIVARDAQTGLQIFAKPISQSSGGGGCSAPSATISVYGNPVLADGVLFVTSFTGEIFAFDSTDGNLKWSKSGFGKIVSRATIFEENVIVVDADGMVTALSQNNGVAVWSYQGSGSIWANPILLNGNLFFGDFKNNYYCINAKDGNQVWKYQGSRGAFYSEAAVIENGSQTLIVVGNFDRSIYAFDAQNGQLVWQTKIAENWFWATPLVIEGRIYAASLDGKIYVLSSDGTNETTISLSDKKEKIVSTPVVAGDRLIVATQKGRLYSIDTANNNAVVMIGSELDEVINAPLTTDGISVLIHTQKNEKIYAINPENGKVSWSKPGRDA